MSLRDAAATLFGPRHPAPSGRRQFFRRAAGRGNAPLPPGLAGMSVEERAAYFGITPGTVVDARGKRLRADALYSPPFIGEIQMVGFTFAPDGWAFCHGQLLPITENDALFALIGTTYGGDGETTFALPDLRGRLPMHSGTGPGLTGRALGEMAGLETVTLTSAQMPSHTHTPSTSSAPGTTDSPGGAVVARPASSIAQYATPADAAPAPLGIAGATAPHDNMPPALALNFCIALFGVFPSQT